MDKQSDAEWLRWYAHNINCVRSTEFPARLRAIATRLEELEDENAKLRTKYNELLARF